MSQQEAVNTEYFIYTGRDDLLSGGVKMIPIETVKGTFNVWTKRIGNNPRIKVLTLHGGLLPLMSILSALIVLCLLRALNIIIMTNSVLITVTNQTSLN